MHYGFLMEGKADRTLENISGSCFQETPHLSDHDSSISSIRMHMPQQYEFVRVNHNSHCHALCCEE